MARGTVLLVFLSVLRGIGRQLALKMGMTQVGQIGNQALAQPLQFTLRVVTNPLVFVGLGLYALGAIAWLGVLSRLALSFAYPFLAVNYAFIPVLAWLLLRESVYSLRWAGIAAICLGVVLISRS